jgi:hypothetical protein
MSTEQQYPQEKLVIAVTQVMAAIQAVEKTGVNKAQGYRYASDADVLGALQPVMAKHGLALIPTSIEANTLEAGQSRQGNPIFRTDVRVTYLLTHTSGGSIPVASAGSGTDSLDKGLYKAMTGALKYALCQTFLIPRLDDAEGGSQPEIHKTHASAAREAQALRERMKISQSRDGKRFLSNWQEFVTDGLLTLIPIGARCGEPVSSLSTGEILDLNTMVLGALGGPLPEDKRTALQALSAAIASEIAKREAA